MTQEKLIQAAKLEKEIGHTQKLLNNWMGAHSFTSDTYVGVSGADGKYLYQCFIDYSMFERIRNYHVNLFQDKLHFLTAEFEAL